MVTERATLEQQRGEILNSLPWNCICGGGVVYSIVVGLVHFENSGFDGCLPSDAVSSGMSPLR